MQVASPAAPRVTRPRARRKRDRAWPGPDGGSPTPTSSMVSPDDDLTFQPSSSGTKFRAARQSGPWSPGSITSTLGTSTFAYASSTTRCSRRMASRRLRSPARSVRRTLGELRYEPGDRTAAVAASTEAAAPTGAPPAPSIPTSAADDASIEGRVGAIWRVVLGRTTIGRDEDLFELGGDSLVALRILTRVLEQFGVEIPLHRVFRAGREVVASSFLCFDLDSRTGASP